MSRLLFTLLLCAYLPLHAQPLTLKAKRLQNAYEAIQRQQHAPVLNMQFIQAFPGNYDDFIDIFNSHEEDQLSINSVAYIKKFRKLGYDYADSVLPKAINIGKDMSAWSYGAVDELQKTIYYVTEKHPMLFIDIVEDMKKNEQVALAKFLYMGENGKNVNYDALVDIVARSGNRKMYKSFTEYSGVTVE